MTNRTVQFWGQGYSTPPGGGLSLTPCTITATLDGTQVFSGTVSTVESSDIGRLPTDQVVLFTCEIPMALEGSIPMELSITGDDIYLEQILANYATIPNPVYTAEQIVTLQTPSTTQTERLAIWEPVASPPLSAEDITFLTNNAWPATTPTLAAHNLTTYISSGVSVFNNITNTSNDARSNVVITNSTYYNAPPTPRPTGAEGTWGWEIETASGQTSIMTFDLNVTAGLE